MEERTGVRIPASRIVVVMPNWLGDGVMATPFLRALRGLYPEAHIAAVARPLVGPVCEGLVDEIKIYGKEESTIAYWMRSQRLDLGVLLPNSFRSAWLLWRGRAKRRLGYARGGRSILLTDRIPAQRCNDQEMAAAAARVANQRLLKEWLDNDKSLPEPAPVDFAGGVRTRRGFKPVPAIDYYLALAKYLGVDNPSRKMELHVTEEEKGVAQIEAAISNLKLADADADYRAIDDDGSAPRDTLVTVVPGANFGASKCWMPDRFAAVIERLIDPHGKFDVRVVLAGSPKENSVCRAIVNAIRPELHSRVIRTQEMVGGKGLPIGALKEIVRRSRLMICNDTGPRHIAAAFGIPTVTLFGPTDPVWAETFSENERIIRVPLPCGPCQLKVCPIDHRCMKGITVEMVMAAVAALWSAK